MKLNFKKNSVSDSSVPSVTGEKYDRQTDS